MQKSQPLGNRSRNRVVMETMDAGSRQSAALPSINFLDLQKIKREEAEYQRKHTTAAMASPSYPYSCPPPPYSNLSSAANSVSGGQQPGLISPPGSRRTSGDEKEERPQPTRQSLPSIHEALGTDSSLSYPVQPPPVPPYPSQSQQQQLASSAPHSDRGPYVSESEAQGPPNPFSQPPTRSPYMHRSQPAVPGPQPPSIQSDPLPPPSFSNSHNAKLPTLHPLQTAQSPTSPARPHIGYHYPQQPSPAYEHGSQPAAPVHAPFGYTHYPPQYPYSALGPNSSGPAFPPSTTYSAPPRYPPTWRSDGTEVNRAEENKRTGRVTGSAYGEAVKRHLDSFDLEASLNEIAEGSGQLLDFARHYGAQSHQTQRSGPVPGSMPKLAEVEDLIQKQQRLQDSLLRIREVVATHQAALAEQAQDQRYKAANGYDQEQQNDYADDSKGGGFAGSDPKKRRGRAAPPGRCHSCNRAETPEWRRGPDGARTLCNACGLHYAKLTRKMGTNKTAVGSSNLRPKSMGSGSPPA